MCGIAGILNLRPGPPCTPEALGRMLVPLQPRGPDGAGRYLDRHIGLAHTRLAIIDQAGGAQPMRTPDGRAWIVFNGELFNHTELRQALQALGHSFRTRSDTEVLAVAWQTWGQAALPRFLGQWAFALWEPAARRLTLARDRFGICPLHLTTHHGRLFFASTPQALFAACADIPRRLDPAALAETFALWSPLSPSTAFEGVRQLPPGHLQVIQDGVSTQRRWWSWSFPKPRSIAVTPAAAAETCHAALEAATKLRTLRADVPVGAYLSGGLDSTLLVALAQESTGRRLTTFSVHFDDPTFDERRWQTLAAEALNTRHIPLRVSNKAIAEAFPEVVEHAARPLLRTAPAPLFLLSQRVRAAGIRVVLTGEGADEIFAGYDLFRAAKVRRFWARQPHSKLRPKLLSALYPTLGGASTRHEAIARRFYGQHLDHATRPGFGHALRWGAAAGLRRLLRRDRLQSLDPDAPVRAVLAAMPPEFADFGPLSQDQALEARTLLSEYLLSAQADRVLMAHGVEGRFPFLDRRVVQAASALPEVLRLPGLQEKALLKHIARARIPEAIRRRKKQPYRAPDAIAFLGDESAQGPPEWVAEVTREAALLDVGLFEPAQVARLLKKCAALAPKRRLSHTDDMALVAVLSTQVLHDRLVRAPLPTPRRAPLDVDVRIP